MLPSNYLSNSNLMRVFTFSWDPIWAPGNFSCWQRNAFLKFCVSFSKCNTPVCSLQATARTQISISSMDLLGVFPTGLATSTPVTNTSQSQGSSDSSGNNKSKSHSTEPATVVNSHDIWTQDFPAAGFMRSNSTQKSRPHIYKQTEHEDSNSALP